MLLEKTVAAPLPACVMLNPTEYLPLFAFGTLRRGESNHHYLAGRYERCLPARLSDYRRAVGDHGFLAIYPAPGRVVDGELFFIRADCFRDVLRDCDLLEELFPGELVGPYYRRAQVVVETGEGTVTAWAYVDPGAGQSP